MDILYLLIPISLVLVAFIALILLWAVRNGQFEDMEGPAYRILMDDDSPVSNPEKSEDELDQAFIHLGLAGEMAVQGRLGHVNTSRQRRRGDLFRLRRLKHFRQYLEDLLFALARLAHAADPATG